MKEFNLRKIKDLVDYDQEVITFKDMSEKEAGQLESILRSFGMTKLGYDKSDKTFNINVYQYVPKLYIDQNHIFVMIVLSGISDDEQREFFSKEVHVKDRIDDMLGNICEESNITYLEDIFTIVKDVMDNNKTLHMIFNDKELDRTKIPTLVISELYSQTISLYDYLYKQSGNFMITRDLVDFVKKLDVQNVIDDAAYQAIKDTDLYKKMKQIIL